MSWYFAGLAKGRPMDWTSCCLQLLQCKPHFSFLEQLCIWQLHVPQSQQLEQGHHRDSTRSQPSLCSGHTLGWGEDSSGQKGLCKSRSHLLVPSRVLALGHPCREHGGKCWAEQAAPSPPPCISHGAPTHGEGRGASSPPWAHKAAAGEPAQPGGRALGDEVLETLSQRAWCLWSLLVAIPAIGAQYSMFQAAPPTKMMEDGKIHTVEHIINPIAVQQDPASVAAAAAAAAVIPAVSTPPPFQVSSAPTSCFPYVPLPICPASHTSCSAYPLWGEHLAFCPAPLQEMLSRTLWCPTALRFFWPVLDTCTSDNCSLQVWDGGNGPPWWLNSHSTGHVLPTLPLSPPLLGGLQFRGWKWDITAI